MAPSNLQKRKHDDILKAKPAKKIRKQQHYSSPSSSSADEKDEFPAVNLADSDTDSEKETPSHPDNPSKRTLPRPEQSTENPTSASDPDPDTDTDTDTTSTTSPKNPNHTPLPLQKQKQKRNDPTAFASSITAILASKLTTPKRADPVLARSTTAAEANASIANSLLEKKAMTKLRQEKKEALEKGRVRDVLLGTDVPGGAGSAEQMVEEERRLRKTAQRGVVKLFNAVRQAQVRGEEAAREAKGAARGRKAERVGEMSKKGFLEMVAGGGVGGEGIGKAEIEEA